MKKRMKNTINQKTKLDEWVNYFNYSVICIFTIILNKIILIFELMNNIHFRKFNHKKRWLVKT